MALAVHVISQCEARPPGLAATIWGPNMSNAPFDPAAESEIIEMALSDQASFAQIKALHGLSPDGVKALMRLRLTPGSYRAWRRRVRAFSDRRASYK